MGSHLACLKDLRQHLREDLNCSAMTSNNTYYLEIAENHLVNWTCDFVLEAFDAAFDLGLSPPNDEAALDESFKKIWGGFLSKEFELLEKGVGRVNPSFVWANSTHSVIQNHMEASYYKVAEAYILPGWRDVLRSMVAFATRMAIMIDNLSMVSLVNYGIGQLHWNGIYDRRDYVGALFGGDVRDKFFFNEFCPKRWDVLRHLLERLAGSSGSDPPRLKMAEVGVDTANVSRRLLEQYPASMLALHVGVDPYGNKPGSTAGDQRYVAVGELLSAYGDRSRLMRTTSEVAVKDFADNEFDLVFLDARHDHDAVAADIASWWPKVRRPGGVLAGHDWQWQYPGLPMAVVESLYRVPVREPAQVNLACDGMWWFDM